jgi:hypothetical protein
MGMPSKELEEQPSEGEEQPSEGKEQATLD